jgi:hypothetical protein
VKQPPIQILAGAMVFALALSGCTRSEGNNDKVRVIDGAGGTVARGPVAEDQIKTILAGKSFQYTGGEGNGIVTYNADGTSEYQDDVKGTLRGSWRAANGMLCESLSPSATLPAGRAESCSQFTNTGDAYYAGKVRLVSI